jgi:hypothetical protein
VESPSVIIWLTAVAGFLIIGLGFGLSWKELDTKRRQTDAAIARIQLSSPGGKSESSEDQQDSRESSRGTNSESPADRRDSQDLSLQLQALKTLGDLARASQQLRPVIYTFIIAAFLFFVAAAFAAVWRLTARPY